MDTPYTRPPSLDSRRPIRSRRAGWARASAAWLARRGVSPDAISAGAVGFGVLGAAAFALGGLTHGPARASAFVLAALSVQGRLVCNLLDGMVAVEHGRGGPHGAIWNELPDRIADILLLAGAGYGAALAGSAWAMDAGWAAAAMAVLTAYVRELGRALGAPTDFGGPGAKPQRMAVLTAAALLCAFEPLWSGRGQLLGAALALIAVLAALTAAGRTRRLASVLSTRHAKPLTES
jgi:phosphatidylglycerophosphate synthase